ncbi:hypothetical protein AAG906_017819 [Vitis piasezkii]
MAASLAEDDLASSMSSRRKSSSSGSRRSWASASICEALSAQGDVFQRSRREDDEEELKWVAIERLPTFERLSKEMPKQVLDDGKVVNEEVDFTNLGMQERKHHIESIPKVVEEDNEKFLLRLRERTDRVGVEIPKIEVRFEHLSIEGDAYVGTRALPTLINSTMNFIEGILGLIRLSPSKKRVVKILKDVSGIVKPSRMTLLLGPPASGKTTLLQALAGKMNKDLRMEGRITYCGNESSEFVPQRTCAYIGQHDLHHGEMTVRETLDFSGRCLGKEAGIKPDPEIDAFMRATETNLVTDYVLKMLGLDICADIMVGDDMRRAFLVEKRSVLLLVCAPFPLIMSYIKCFFQPSGEMLVRPAKALFMDEISTGLDSSTTFQIVKFMRQMVHIMEGQIVYQGPRENILEFFEGVGFKCPERKGVVDFLHEVTSKGPRTILQNPTCSIGDRKVWNLQLGTLQGMLCQRVAIDEAQLFTYIFKTTQITIMSVIAMTVFFRTEMKHGQLQDGVKFNGALFYGLINVMYNGMAELALTIFRLPVFFKQRDLLFYPAWAFALPIWVLRIPLSLMESGIWIILTYYTIGFAPSASRFFRQLVALFLVHQMALSLFRFIAALGRTQIVANTLATFTLLLVFVRGGFIVSKDDIEPWMIWAYYASPMTYGQNALVINEFLDDRWSAPNINRRIPEPTVGKALLKERGMFVDGYWYWICVALEGSNSVIIDEDDEKRVRSNFLYMVTGVDMEVRNTGENTKSVEMKSQGIEVDRLQLLWDASGAFRPGILTALVGVSSAGKTTLMDVLAGRKTGGYIEGRIRISGFPQDQATFARVSGYCAQNDIHSPHVTVYESLVYSAWLRLAPDVKKETRQMFVEEVMDLVGLHPLRNALVGLPGIDGLSTEQRKRLTVGVELVANPSIIFMDEPTTGLDARAARIVMRTVRNIVDTGRTVVCTIHQPSIDIFEAFDELLLMKRGGQIIYAGPLGRNSHKLVEYFEAVPGVPKVRDGQNPATWMLEVSSAAVEAQLGVDFAEIYAKSELYQRNQELIKELSTPSPGSKNLYFPTKYSQSFIAQCKACFWKQHWSYWRNPPYNAIRFFLTIIIGVLFGAIFRNKGKQTDKEQDLINLLGAMFSAVFFLGTTNTAAVQPVVAIERTVFYRERAAGMYSALPYAFAQVAIEAIYLAIQTCLYSLLLYSMMGFYWRVDKFLWFYYYLFMCFIYFTLYGMMIVALTPSHQIAAIVMSFFLSFWNLFSGFLIHRMQIPIWWRWYYWASPVAWTIYGLVTSQVGDKEDPVQVPGADDMSVKQYLKEALGFEYDFLGAVALAHIGWVLLFLFVFAYGIKFLDFQRR